MILVVGPTELESVTSCVSSRRSNQLSYGPGEGWGVSRVRASQYNMGLRYNRSMRRIFQLLDVAAVA
jgi:hypothetical protein